MAAGRSMWSRICAEGRAHILMPLPPCGRDREERRARGPCASPRLESGGALRTQLEEKGGAWSGLEGHLGMQDRPKPTCSAPPDLAQAQRPVPTVSKPR